MMEDFKMSPLVWLSATTVAAVAMISYASAYIYTRNEGDLLEKRVDQTELKINRVNDDVQKRLDRIEDKIDRLVEQRLGR